jgi:hypothetical protein
MANQRMDISFGYPREFYPSNVSISCRQDQNFRKNHDHLFAAAVYPRESKWEAPAGRFSPVRGNFQTNGCDRRVLLYTLVRQRTTDPPVVALRTLFGHLEQLSPRTSVAEIPMRATLLCLIAGLLFGCTSPAPESPYASGWIGQPLPPEQVDMQSYTPPESLAGFVLAGEMDFPGARTRLFRYRRQDNGEQEMDLAIYPLPAGWSELPPERAVAGHYGKVRQGLAHKSTQRDARLSVISEQLVERSGFRYPLAEAVLFEETDDWSRHLVVIIGARAPLFVRLSAQTGPDAADALLAAMRDSLAAYMQQLESGTQQSTE